MTMINMGDKMQAIKNQKFISIIIPTFNESKNIINLLKQIQQYIPTSIEGEIIVVDDNSPDGTGSLVEQFIKDQKKSPDSTTTKGLISKIDESYTPIKIIHRKAKTG